MIGFLAIFGDFWGWEPRLYSENKDFQNLSVLDDFYALHHFDVIDIHIKLGVWDLFYYSMTTLKLDVVGSEMAPLAETLSYVAWLYEFRMTLWVIVQHLPSIQNKCQVKKKIQWLTIKSNNFYWTNVRMLKIQQFCVTYWSICLEALIDIIWITLRKYFSQPKKKKMMNYKILNKAPSKDWHQMLFKFILLCNIEI